MKTRAPQSIRQLYISGWAEFKEQPTSVRQLYTSGWAEFKEQPTTSAA